MPYLRIRFALKQVWSFRFFLLEAGQAGLNLLMNDGDASIME